MRVRLRVVGDRRSNLADKATHVFDEAGGEIGRNAACAWPLPDETKTLSARHASISAVGGGFVITDTSTNGVYLNTVDAPLGRGVSAPLADGDLLYLGPYTIAVEVVAEAADSRRRLGVGEGWMAVRPPGGEAPPWPAGPEDLAAAVAPPSVDPLAALAPPIVPPPALPPRRALPADPVAALDMVPEASPEDVRRAPEPDIMAELARLRPAPAPRRDSIPTDLPLMPPPAAPRAVPPPPPAPPRALPPLPVPPNATPAGPPPPVPPWREAPEPPIRTTPGGASDPAEPPVRGPALPPRFADPAAAAFPAAGRPGAARIPTDFLMPPPARPPAGGPVPGRPASPLAAGISAASAGQRPGQGRFSEAGRFSEPGGAPEESRPADPNPAAVPPSAVAEPDPALGRRDAPLPPRPAPPSTAAEAPQDAVSLLRMREQGATGFAAPAPPANLLARLGIDAAALPPSAARAAEEAVADFVLEAAEGLVAVLAARRAVREELRLDRTSLAPVDNNPFKFFPTGQEALKRMLGGRAPPGFSSLAGAARAGFDDIKAHELAVIAALQGVAAALVSRLSPAAIEQAGDAGLFGRPDKARLWERYGEAHARLADTLDVTVNELFAREMARALERRGGSSNGDSDR